ncbi:MAG: hypothetical protein ACTS6J_02890 [Burkholderiales bacterium]
MAGDIIFEQSVKAAMPLTGSGRRIRAAGACYLRDEHAGSALLAGGGSGKSPTLFGISFQSGDQAFLECQRISTARAVPIASPTE